MTNGLAVRQGFEPWVGLLRPYNGLANRRLQPLGHLTAAPSLHDRCGRPGKVGSHESSGFADRRRLTADWRLRLPTAYFLRPALRFAPPFFFAFLALPRFA